MQHIVIVTRLVLFSWACFSLHTLHAQRPAKSLPVYLKDGRLAYTPDSFGNRIPDFSYCGYKAGESSIPAASIKIIVPAVPGDATFSIQDAIDEVSKLPPDKDGLRGAVLLQKGTYHVQGSLHLHTSGVVLRGSGFGKDGTIIIGEGKDRETLIRVEGKDDRTPSGMEFISSDYVPVNATQFHVSNAENMRVGQEVIIARLSVQEWIDALGTAHFGGGITALGWKPGQRSILWARTITSVEGNTVTIDVPLTTALETKYGGAAMTTLRWPGRIQNCGVENLQLISAYDTTHPKDEDHRWMAITINNARDAWVRQVSFKHFAGSAVAVYENASRITVEDCLSFQPVSEIGGERRNTFFTAGTQTLFQRCYAEYGMHDFATGFCAPGPNAFVQCESYLPYSFSGGLDSWASGVLFDIVNIDGNAISFFNRGQDGQGAGWNIANSLLWNCTAARIDCYKPPTAQNWAFGSWAQFAGDGYWAESNNAVEPRSLYYAQLKDRTGIDGKDHIMHVETEASSSPTVDVANALTKLAAKPAKTLKEFIYDAPLRRPIATQSTMAKVAEMPVFDTAIRPATTSFHVKDGKLLLRGWLPVGARNGVPWWSGSARPYALDKAAPAITRFVPGRTGKGLTDDLALLTDSMVTKNIIAVEHNYGLWYDRRRDDHERIRRMDGDVWAPFYELPFARSGQGTAWDGLSKYDLTKYNYWYWNRLQSFAFLAENKDRMLLHQHYFQHNIIEAGAHYADFPWRPANNINNTGFPEPVPYAGDKRIFMAEQFYDETHPVRRPLHRAYIRKCLENFRHYPNVIHTIGEEFTGPLHFVQFWIDMIKEWELETGIHPLIALSTTKDVQDAILADPERAGVIDIIDIRYWHYQADGTLYAPQGGQNLAPRQHARLLKPKSTSLQQVYRAISEYRQKYPGKAVIYSADGADRNGWAVLMAGGSLPNIRSIDGNFLSAIAAMQPLVTDSSSNQWVLHGKSGYVIYNNTETMHVPAGRPGTYKVNWINAATGDVYAGNDVKIKARNPTAIRKPFSNAVLWLIKNQ